MSERFSFRTIVASILLFAALFVGALAFDYFLHLLGLVSIGRYFGIVGTVLLILSLAYSLRKHRIVEWSTHQKLLVQHEWLGWLGSMMILVHAGIHFNAMVPWIAAIAMVVVVASGLTGKYLLRQARESLNVRRAELVKSGRSDLEIEQVLMTDALLVNSMQRWRAIHLPLTMIFTAYALLHIISTLLLWGWK